MKRLLPSAIFLLLGQVLYGSKTHQCPAFGSEQSIYGWMLQRHIYKTMMADLGLDCLSVCRKDDRCQSFNFVISLHMCEFSDRTKVARPEDFIPDPDRFYFRRDINRVPLGSIAELAAESCKEIKESEGEIPSGKYWLSSIKRNMTINAYCDMKTEDVDECTASSPVCDVSATCNNTLGSYRCTCKVGYYGDGRNCTVLLGSTPEVPAGSCQEIKASEGEEAATGKYWLNSNRSSYLTYCHMESSGQGWTLIARFSNTDAINWMIDSGEWWYDKNVAVGETTDPSKNTDMISPAFWQVSAKELKITRSDDPQHTTLLQTTSDCLGGQTVRSKMTSYGVFRNTQQFHDSSSGCRGSCDVQYGGQYNETGGFAQAECNDDMQSANKIGFCCVSRASGCVVMIGGGGDSCHRSHHGLGITGSKSRAFYAGSGRPEKDFGDSPWSSGYSPKAYSLNLWIH